MARRIIDDGSRLALAEIDDQVGERLRQFRLERKVSRTSLARKLRVSTNTLAKYEQGEERCPASILFLASQALGVSLVAFFENLETRQ